MTLPVLIEQILVQMSGIPADFLGANEIITNLPSSMWLPQNFLMTIFNLIRLLCPAIQLWENLSTNRLSWITCIQVWKKAPSLNTVAFLRSSSLPELDTTLKLSKVKKLL